MTKEQFHIFEPSVKYFDKKTGKIIFAFKESDEGKDYFVIFEKRRENLPPAQREEFEEIWIDFRDNAFDDDILLFDIDDIMSEVEKHVDNREDFPFELSMDIMDHGTGKRIKLITTIAEMPIELKLKRYDEDNEYWECEEKGCDFFDKLPEDGILPKKCPKCGSKYVSTVTWAQSET